MQGLLKALHKVVHASRRFDGINYFDVREWRVSPDRPIRDSFLLRHAWQNTLNDMIDQLCSIFRVKGGSYE